MCTFPNLYIQLLALAFRKDNKIPVQSLMVFWTHSKYMEGIQSQSQSNIMTDSQSWCQTPI
jgi:hypothetical protein